MVTLTIFLLSILVIFQPKSLSKSVNPLDKPQKSMKGIVVMPPNLTYSDFPYVSNLWSTHYEKILTTVGKDAEVVVNEPEYAFSIIHVPEDEYEQIVNSLRSEGYFVRDEYMGRIHLDESVPAIEGPYEWDDVNGHQELTGVDRIITIIDTGIYAEHPDFSGKILDWYDGYDYFNDPVDLNGHGTHVAGIAAGTGAASGGQFRGVAPDAKLKVARGCDAIGQCSEYSVYKALKWAVGDGSPTDVITMSLGFKKHSTEEKCTGLTPDGYVRWIHDKINEAISNGITVVASAGNEGIRSESIEFPACIDDVVAVGMTSKKAYGNIDLQSFDVWSGSSPVNVIVEEVDGITIVDARWEGQSSYGTGLHFTWYVDEPTTIRVKIQGMWKYRCPFYSEGWDPGDDEYWEWVSETFPANTNIVVVIGVRPIYNVWNLGICFETNYNNNDNTIRVRIAETTKGLKDEVILNSGRGPAPQDTDKPDVVAPGYKICAPRLDGDNGGELICGNDQYIAKWGASMAAPHVAGLVALLKEARPDITYVSDIMTALKQADKHAYDPYLHPYLEGEGRINITKAVTYIANIGSCSSLSDCCCDFVCDNGNCVKCSSNHVQINDNKCESADTGTHCTHGNKGSWCTASAECDEKTPNTELESCTIYGADYLQDKCTSTCGIIDTTCEVGYVGCTASYYCDEKSPNTILWGDYCSFGDDYTIDKCDSTCRRVDTNICDDACGALYHCEHEESGKILDNVCSYGNSKTKDKCCKTDTRICDEQCGADSKCNNVEYLQRGSCPSGQICDFDCQCVNPSSEGGGSGGCWSCLLTPDW